MTLGGYFARLVNYPTPIQLTSHLPRVLFHKPIGYQDINVHVKRSYNTAKLK
jgi:hypothetical protein